MDEKLDKEGYSHNYDFGLCFSFKSDIELLDLTVDSVKNILGPDTAFTGSQISELSRQAITEVEVYCNRLLNVSYVPIIVQIALAKLNRLNAEGLSAMSMSGVSESYIDGWPDNVKAVLKSKRKMLVL